jgi:predicted transcriptional regulator
MADLKTEMSKVLNAWEKDEHDTLARPMIPMPDGRVVFGITNNVSRETFNFVKNNPAQTHQTVTEALAKRGFKKTSVASLLTQFVKQRLISRDEDGVYYAEVEEYSPLKSTKKLRAEGKSKTKIVKSPRSQGIAALKVEPKLKKKETSLTGVIPSAMPAPVITTAWDAETIISNIGLKQAHKLFLELQTYFGG